MDGGIHMGQQSYDHERELSLRDIGLRVLRFANTEIEHNLEAVLNVTLQTCQLQEGGKTES